MVPICDISSILGKDGVATGDEQEVITYVVAASANYNNIRATFEWRPLA